MDANGRLADGRAAVEDFETYVEACRLLGYSDPDLTAYTAQVRDWYDREDGLDLRALDADCAALAAAATTTEEAVKLQVDLRAALAGAWLGSGSDAAHDFLRRHGEAAATVAAGMRVAADTLSSLRDNLWRLVDEKVGAVLSIDERLRDRRGEWLAAAKIVITGVGDRAAASELVDQQIK